MASFFDSKQEVIDFQITPHGKRLLSKGKFKPSYYSFVDEGVVYDDSYIGVINENQNNIEPRIQDGTPTLKSIPLSYGIERDIKEKGNIKEKLLIDELSLLSNSGVSSEYSPSWSITLLKNTIINTTPFYTSSDGLYVRIPQINVSCSYKEQIMLDKVYVTARQSLDKSDFGLDSNDSTTFEFSPLSALSSENISINSLQIQSEISGRNSTFLTSRHFQDGTIFTIEEDEVVIDLMQLNTGVDEEYEIEVFKYEKDKNGNEIVIPLDFQFKENQNLIDDILVDVESNFTTLPIDSNKVEYFIDLNSDREIDQRIICSYIVPMTKGKGINNSLACKRTNDRTTTGRLYNNNIIGGETSIVLDSQGNAILQPVAGAIDPTSVSNKVIC